jgi:hypothetical protein
MGFVLTAEREGDAEGVTLAQLNEVTERATQECIQRGIDPATVTPKTLNRLGGKIKSISITV